MVCIGNVYLLQRCLIMNWQNFIWYCSIVKIFKKSFYRYTSQNCRMA